MSNLVVWHLLAPLLLRTLETIVRDPVETLRLEKERENHPLVLFVEENLMKMYKPSGGLSCPELEKLLKRDLEERPERVKEIVENLVRAYYAWRRRTRSEVRYGALVYA